MPMIWKFVATPESSATVLLDMNDEMTWKTLGGEFFKLPSPPERRSIATNNLTDGGLVTAKNYDLRQLVFTLELTAPSEAGRIAQLDALKRRLSGPGLLMYKPKDGAYPVFFQTLSGEYELDNQFIPGVAWRVPCSVLAQPFALGERHDITVGAVVTNDPANGTNRTFIDITGVRGDSPSPAFARVSSGFAAASVFMLAQRTANNPTALTVFTQAEAGTMGTDTTTIGNDSSMSGTGINPVSNPGFEVNNANWTPAAGTLTRDTAQFHSGVASGRYDATSASGTRVSNSNSFNVTEGVTYSASGWVRSGTGPFTQARVNIRWFDSGASTITTTVGSFVTLSTTWTEATVSAAAPVGAVTAHVRVEFSPDPLAVAASAFFDDVTFSPGSNFARTTFGTNTLITRVTVPIPSATSGEALRGRYRVYARVRRSASTSAFLVRYKAGGVTGLSVAWSTSMPNTWHLDLGMVDVPSYGPGPQAIGYSGLAPALTQLSLEIQAQRSSGSLNLDIDYVYLLPADERQCSFQQVGTPNSIILDGPNDTIYGLATGSTPFDPDTADRTIDNGGGLIPRQGGLPVLVPGVTNRLYALRAGQSNTSTSTWEVSYWPYWREVATS